ncbi:MAG: hypothetical protein HUJ27_15665 [Rhodobacteraceae bacterium]|nr:hypothetical protein [Paracoccaceae bacterium]
MRHAFVLACLVVLSGCASPRERCETAATEDLRVVDQLIAETQQNLERGYSIREETTVRTRFTFCGMPSRNVTFCSEPVTERREIPEAIDPAAEQRKLNQLLAKRAELQQRSAIAVAECRSAFPEG